MADVSLDDLIQQDKKKNKTQHNNQKTFKKKHIVKQHPRQDRRPPLNNSNHPRNRPHPQGNQPRNKFQGKRFQAQDNQEPRQGKFKPQRPKEEAEQEETEQKDKQFRTLKVMGLSPEFTNEDLYKLFATEGAMEKCLIQQDNFGRSLNTAIVKYYSPQAAKSAIQNLNRHKIMNCVLTVEPYKNVKK